MFQREHKLSADKAIGCAETRRAAELLAECGGEGYFRRSEVLQKVQNHLLNVYVMQDYLPPIHINVTGSRRNFLKKIAEIAEKSGIFAVETELDALGKSTFDIVKLLLVKSAQHTGLGGLLIVQPEAKNKVSVEISAERWNSDNPPTYETYVGEAKALIGPLLSAYNRDVGTRHHMMIPAKRMLEPKLPPQSAELFKHFIALANKSCLHPLDWHRFYKFVRDSRIRRPLFDEDMAHLLIKEGFSEQYADHIAKVYGHLREFKQGR